MWGGTVSSCKSAAHLTPATQRRLLADLKRLHDEPIPLAAAAPCAEKDLTLWNGVIGVEMEVTDIGRVTVPLHFLIDFPHDYPQSAPNIGFSFEFQYRGGAEYIMPDGRLKGKKVICLDVLGNFNGVHTEWKHEVGSGWSPAYSVTTLLVQLQSVLCDLGNNMSQRERDITYQSAVRFCEKNPSSILELLDEDDIKDRREQLRSADRVKKACGGDSALAKRAEQFAQAAGFDSNKLHMDEFLSLLADVVRVRSGTTSGSTTISEDEAEKVDANICCFATGKLYTEAVLGVGVARERKNLATAGELLSKEAYDGGLRQNTNKSAFEFFLPVWINEAHATKQKEWVVALRSGYMTIGKQVFDVDDEDTAIIEVFPRLINQMIVEIMRPDAGKSEAIATFEALCNFWRTLRWLVDTRESLRSRVSSSLTKFTSDEAHRHKDETPDLGVILVLFTVFQGHTECPSRANFIDAYLDENSLRQVMWWQRAGTPAQAVPVFQATKVSREICMFQMMVLDVVIADCSATLQRIEQTNCKLPDRLETLQVQWRKQKAETDTWAKYFTTIKASRPAFASVDLWIQECVSRAGSKGPKYGGAKGQGKGSSNGGKGRAGGKGWNR